MPLTQCQRICFTAGFLLWCWGFFTLISLDAAPISSGFPARVVPARYKPRVSLPLPVTQQSNNSVNPSAQEMKPYLNLVMDKILHFNLANLEQPPMEEIPGVIQEYIDDLIPFTKNLSSKCSGRGIVMTFPPRDGISELHNILIAIRALREAKCDLPVQIFYEAHNIPSWSPSSCALALAKKLNVGIAPFDFEGSKEIGGGYVWKPIAILQSTFKEVIFLDADNVAMGDLNSLFEDAYLHDVNGIFWPDIKKIEEGPIWSFHDQRAFNKKQMTAETAQLVVIKDETAIAAVALTALMTYRHWTFDMWVYPSRKDSGDATMFLHSWPMVGAPFIFAPNPVFGIVEDTPGCQLNALLQRDFNRKIMFFHHGGMKLNGISAWYTYLEAKFSCQSISDQDADQVIPTHDHCFSIAHLDSKTFLPCMDHMVEPDTESPLHFLLRAVTKLRDEGYEQCLDAVSVIEPYN